MQQYGNKNTQHQDVESITPFEAPSPPRGSYGTQGRENWDRACGHPFADNVQDNLENSSQEFVSVATPHDRTSYAQETITKPHKSLIAHTSN